MGFSNLKGYKVTDVPRSKICGIACHNLETLIEKGRGKLKIDKSEKVLLYLQDGTIVDNDEYFNTVPPQTLFILAKVKEKVVTGADLIYNVLKSVNSDIIKTGAKIRQFFDDEDLKKLRMLTDSVLKSGDTMDKASLSSSKDDPDWFKGLEMSFKDKESVLSRRCQDRMRSYFYKTSGDLKSSVLYKSDLRARAALDKLLTRVKSLLSKNCNLGFYFDRSKTGRLCDPKGQFKCQGAWAENRCVYINGLGHYINPYSSREERILFSTWNLDHRIERSRTIVPTILKSAEKICENGSTSDLNHEYFFKLLFTTYNLKLVHIVCHDKKEHVKAVCDEEKVFCPLEVF